MAKEKEKEEDDDEDVFLSVLHRTKREREEKIFFEGKKMKQK